MTAISPVARPNIKAGRTSHPESFRDTAYRYSAQFSHFAFYQKVPILGVHS